MKDGEVGIGSGEHDVRLDWIRALLMQRLCREVEKNGPF